MKGIRLYNIIILNILDQNILKDLPSYMYYSKFNEPINISDYNEECQDIYNKCNGNEKIKDIYAKYARNFKMITELKRVEERKAYCTHFIYWMYDEIRKLIKNNDSTGHDIRNHTNFNNIRERIIKKKNMYVCLYLYEGGKFDEWKEEKDLYDYFENYETLYRKINSDNNECHNYIKYLNYIYNLYKKHSVVEKCCTDYKYGWESCDYFKCDYAYHPLNLLSKLNCEGNKYAQKESGSFNPVDSEASNAEGQKQKDLQMKISYLKCFKSYKDENKKEGEKDSMYANCYYITPHKLSKNVTVYTYNRKSLHSGKPMSVVWTLPSNEDSNEEGEFKKLEYSRNDIEDDTGIRSIYDFYDIKQIEYNILEYIPVRIGVVIMLTLGVFLVFFLYYKVTQNFILGYKCNFTPFGSWINRKTRKNKKIIYSKDPIHSRKLSANSNKSVRQKHPNKRAHIAYQSK
ncbi:variable surface protein [Plasmodium gonderi]|uniref:Variable surface protein n=1 Tax=Plasmodium gonderi TaxID=77519 RepID=A0A1Y1J9B5_PLAGO|nr:variable surface protein [Plasmodium gonderi]GAW78860.1 variable surface protein [Plasmodium gonderi]